MELREVAKSHWGNIWRDPASYGIGNIHGERYNILMRAVDAGQLMVEEALSPEYLENERLKNEESKRGLEEAPAGLARAQRAGAVILQQVYSGINNPMPARVVQPVPNPYYNGHNQALAFRQPNGMITGGF